MNSGTFITSWGGTGTANGLFNSPVDIGFGSSGTVFVTDFYNHRIQQFSTAGSYLSQMTYAGFGKFSTQYSVASDSIGNVYVADTGNNRVQEFTRTGAFLIGWGSLGS